MLYTSFNRLSNLNTINIQHEYLQVNSDGLLYSRVMSIIATYFRGKILQHEYSQINCFILDRRKLL